MNQDRHETQPIDGAGTVDQDPPPATTSAPPPPPPPSGPGHRVLGLRGVAAVALASLVLGGLGGAALGAVSDGVDSDRRGPGGQFVPGQQGQVPGGQPGRFPGRDGQQGLVPPGTDPLDDGAPDPGADDSRPGTTT